MNLDNIKVWVASSGLGHVARGIESWAHDLGNALVERGLNARLCRGAGLPATPSERTIPCLKRTSSTALLIARAMPSSIAWRLGVQSGYGVEQASFAWSLIRGLRREDVDLLHVQDPLVALYVQRARQLGYLKTRVILAHGTEEPYCFLRKLRYVQHLAPWHLEDAANAGYARRTWTSIPNFIDTNEFGPGTCRQMRQDLGIASNAFLVLVAAAVKRTHKRIDYVLSEFARLRQLRPDMQAHLVIAGGESSESASLIRSGRELLGDRVSFLIGFPRPRMPELYRAADLFTLGSLKEMMPIALLEATASGVPCVVHQHPVMQWMIGPGGWPVDMSREGALAEQIAQVHDQSGLRRLLQVRARRHCAANFGREAVVDQICDYYRFVAGDGAQAGRSRLERGRAA